MQCHAIAPDILTIYLHDQIKPDTEIVAQKIQTFKLKMK